MLLVNLHLLMLFLVHMFLFPNPLLLNLHRPPHLVLPPLLKDKLLIHHLHLDLGLLIKFLLEAVPLSVHVLELLLSLHQLVLDDHVVGEVVLELTELLPRY